MKLTLAFVAALAAAATGVDAGVHSAGPKTLKSLAAEAQMLKLKYAHGKQNVFDALKDEAEFGILPIDDVNSAWNAEIKKGHGVPLT
ncbi:hypothetical protein IE53DRAFT_371048, partial [Violaceomyces palustris]